MANVTANVTQPVITVTTNSNPVTVSQDSNVITSIDITTLNVAVSSTETTVNVSPLAAIGESTIREALSVDDTGGDGSLTYSNITGIFTYTGPNQAEANARISAAPQQVRQHLSATLPITYNSTTGDIGFDANLDDLTLKKYQETIVDNGTDSGNISANITDGTVHEFTLDGDVTGITLNNIATGGSATLFLNQDAIGGNQLDTTTHASNWTDWIFTSEFTDLSTSGSKINILNVFYDGTTYYASLVTETGVLVQNSDLANSSVTFNGVTVELGSSGNIDTFNSNVNVNASLTVSNDLDVDGAAEVTGVLTLSDEIDSSSDIKLSGDIYGKGQADLKLTNATKISLNPSGNIDLNAVNVKLGNDSSSPSTPRKIVSNAPIHLLAGEGTGLGADEIFFRLQSTPVTGGVGYLSDYLRFTRRGNVELRIDPIPGGGHVYPGGFSILNKSNVALFKVWTDNDVTVGLGSMNVSKNVVIGHEDSTAQNRYLTVDRTGYGSPDVHIRWNHSDNKWQLTEDGSTYANILTGTSTVVNSVTAGDGLVNSGTAADPVINVGSGGYGITVTADAVSVNNTDIQAQADISFGNKTTDDLTEGSTNQYYTTAKANSAITTYFGDNGNSPFTINGNLQVQGNIDYVNVEDLLVNDQSITLNYGNATARDAFIYVDRSGSTLTNAHIKWNETADQWEVFDGTSTIVIGEQTVESVNGQTGVVVLDTDDVAQGTTNLYFANSLARAAVSASGDLSYNVSTGVFSVTTYKTADFNTDFATKTTTDLTEGANLYYTDARVDTHLNTATANATQVLSWTGTDYDWVDAATGGGNVDSVNGQTGVVVLDTDDISEGATNQYYSTSLFNVDFATKTTTDLTEGTNLYWTTDRGNTNSDAWLTTKTTSDLTEGTNLYYTDARVEAYLSGNTSTINADTIQANSFIGGTFTGDGSDLTDVRAQTVEEKVKNVSGGTLAKGTPVYATGVSTSDVQHVDACDASDPAKMPCVGVLATALNNDEEGRAIITGKIAGVDTSTFVAGDQIFIAVGGGYANVAPTGEDNIIQFLGTVTLSDASGGGIVKIAPPRATPNLNSGNIFLGNATNNSVTATLDTSIVPENGNLYYTNARVNAFIQDSITTTDIDEGTNLYYTTDRANSAIENYSGNMLNLNNTVTTLINGDDLNVVTIRGNTISSGNAITGETFLYAQQQSNTSTGGVKALEGGSTVSNFNNYPPFLNTETGFFAAQAGDDAANVFSVPRFAMVKMPHVEQWTKENIEQIGVPASSGGVFDSTAFVMPDGAFAGVIDSKIHKQRGYRYDPFGNAYLSVGATTHTVATVLFDTANTSTFVNAVEDLTAYSNTAPAGYRTRAPISQGIIKFRTQQPAVAAEVPSAFPYNEATDYANSTVVYIDDKLNVGREDDGTSYSFPKTAGTEGQFLQLDANNDLQWVDEPQITDAQFLNLLRKHIGSINFVDGGLGNIDGGSASTTTFDITINGGDA